MPSRRDSRAMTSSIVPCRTGGATSRWPWSGRRAPMRPHLGQGGCQKPSRTQSSLPVAPDCRIPSRPPSVTITLRANRRSGHLAGRSGWSSGARGNECSVASRQLCVRAQVRWPAFAGDERGRSVELVPDHRAGAAMQRASWSRPRTPSRVVRPARPAWPGAAGPPGCPRVRGVAVPPRAPAGGRSSSRRWLQRSSSACRRRPAEAGCRASRAGCHRARRAPRPRPLTARTPPWRAAPRRRR
jgi:hypothetical protein